MCLGGKCSLVYGDTSIVIYSAYMAYDEIGEINADRYLGEGKWRAEATDMDKCFSKELAEAQGYRFDRNDYYMGYDVYTKIVGYESLTSVDMPMEITEAGKRRDACVRIDVPSCLKEEADAYLIASGNIFLPDNIVEKLVGRYTPKELLELEKEQGRRGELFCSLYGGWKLIDYTEPRK